MINIHIHNDIKEFMFNPFDVLFLPDLFKNLPPTFRDSIKAAIKEFYGKPHFPQVSINFKYFS